MQIQVHTDNNIDGPEQLTADIEIEVASALERFSDHLTRVQVHLSDEGKQHDQHGRTSIRGHSKE